MLNRIIAKMTELTDFYHQLRSLNISQWEVDSQAFTPQINSLRQKR
ncbi:hypothetical protein [Thalassotalea atypica]|nr:hypothetical protein [Thalassotalea atypica]